jgi:hypothetical protein
MAPKPRFEVGLGVLGSIGTGAHVTIGGVLHFGVSTALPGSERSRLLFALEGRVDAPTTDAYGVQTQLFAGTGVVCGTRDLTGPSSTNVVGVMLCALGRGGVLRASDGPNSRSFAYGAAGARLGLDARFGSLLILRPQLEIVPTLVDPHRIQWLGHPVPIGSVAGSMGLTAALLF